MSPEDINRAFSELVAEYNTTLATFNSISRTLKSSYLLGPSHACVTEWDQHRKVSVSSCINMSTLAHQPIADPERLTF